MNRIKILKIALILGFSVISVRLFQIQIIDHSKYVAAASSEHTRKFELPATRGEIHFMSGNTKTVPVVMNESVWTVFVDPSYVSSKEKVQSTLSEILGDKISLSWDKIWSNMDLQYLEIAKNVNFTEITAVEKANLKGVGKKRSSRRVYPYEEFASQVLGFINAEQVGYGAEGALNKDLAGKNGTLKTIADVNNIPLTIGDDNIKIPAENGKNIALTIDENIQRKAESTLVETLKKDGITEASALVMDPNTGQIYAMANLPSYNPEQYWKVTDPKVYLNRTLDEPYEAASVCKTFTYAVAIEQGSIKPTDTYTNTGSTKVGEHTIYNARRSNVQSGNITFQTALNYSLNTGSVEVLRRLGDGKITKSARSILYDSYHNRFNLGKKTGIELYEAPGVVISPEKLEGSAIRYANMTFGQGLDITMVQAAAAFSSTINGGNYYTPTVIAGEVKNSTLIPAAQKAPAHQAISEFTSATMRDMLVGVRSVVYGPKKDLPGYKIGVKSGTAETLDEKGEYTSDRTIASFIGFGGRADDSLPEYVVMIRLGGNKLLWGSSDAEPVFTEISNFMLEYLKIKPKGK